MTNNFLTDQFSYGIIMGYYGPIWSNEALNDYADFLCSVWRSVRERAMKCHFGKIY